MDTAAAPSPGDLVSIPEAATELGMPVRTLQYQCQTGKIAATKVGRDFVIARAEVDRIKAERAAEAAAGQEETP